MYIETASSILIESGRMSEGSSTIHLLRKKAQAFVLAFDRPPWESDAMQRRSGFLRNLPNTNSFPLYCSEKENPFELLDQVPPSFPLHLRREEGNEEEVEKE